MGAGSMAGSMFGRYELRRLLGVGGMGEVYEAYDTSKSRTVALKMLNRELARDPVYVQRFRRESHAMASVQEPHVIPVHDWGEVDGVLYIDMRLVKGSDLKERLQRHGSLTPGESVQVVEQIAAALDAAHEAGLVHRDVKPANILLTGNLFAYLVDFGIAHTATDPQLTNTGSAVGSMAYMAPERFENAPLTPAVDTYALSCVLYESLVGRVPFPVNSLAGAIGSHQMAPPPRPSTVDPALAPFDPIIERGMAKRPEQRYATPGDLSRAARGALIQIERNAPATEPGPQIDRAMIAARGTGDQPHGVSQPHGMNRPDGTSQPHGRSQPLGTSQDHVTGQPYGAVQPHGTGEPMPGIGQQPPGASQSLMKGQPPTTVRQSGAGQPLGHGRTGDVPALGTVPQTGFGGTGVQAGGYSNPSVPLPVPPQRNSSTPILAGALGALIVVAVVGVAVWIMLSINGSEQTVAEPPSTTDVAPPSPVIETVSQTVPTPDGTAAPPPSPPKTTVPPLNSSVSDADDQGFLYGGPRCNDNDAAMTIARTSASRLVICRTGAGRYYYKGARDSDGDGLELDDPVPTGGGGFTATNPVDGTRYQITSAGLTIVRDGTVLASESMAEFAYR
ncbi:protein kinase [Nocardia sp. NPDC058176]|uniref:serine/threonine-protein kinase n=1 Tax=Nocardia sp. NPDC058176 TaxID=3346368 RepID=UPI0036D9011F